MAITKPSVLLGDRYTRLEFNTYLLFWALILISPLLIRLYLASAGIDQGFSTQGLANRYLTIMIFLGFFLVNNFLLLPKLFLRKRYLAYIVGVLILMVAVWYLPVHPAPHGGGPRPMRPDQPDMRPPVDMFRVGNEIVALCLLFANGAVKLYVQSLRKEANLIHMQSEQMRSELESLKYQINPHFLMNSLNNIQALVEIDSERACEAIQKLSNLMRHLLYDAGENLVSMQSELQFMNSFIGLMKMRYPDNLKIETDFRVDDEDLKVPPLLFITFVENAFKHGVDYDSDSNIKISLCCDDEAIRFRCVNTISPTPAQNRGGLGIENVKRRLDLIYGDSHRLDIRKNADTFAVSLSIPK